VLKTTGKDDFVTTTTATTATPRIIARHPASCVAVGRGESDVLPAMIVGAVAAGVHLETLKGDSTVRTADRVESVEQPEKVAQLMEARSILATYFTASAQM
jgi:hypothetical protein